MVWITVRVRVTVRATFRVRVWVSVCVRVTVRDRLIVNYIIWIWVRVRARVSVSISVRVRVSVSVTVMVRVRCSSKNWILWPLGGGLCPWHVVKNLLFFEKGLCP